ncbi:DUF1617 family protein [Heyndrickxia sporothermodurans]|uniref:DUF1617 family protein n=1 Tax=Heyndrickxia sporothermodurans TaxID=46224 RepID=UPI0035DCE9F9
MSKVEIENQKLIPTVNFMYNLKLARKQSRFRRHFINLLNERLKRYEDDRKELLEEHANKDADGKPIINDNQYDIKDMAALNKDMKELNEEKLVIEGGDNGEMIRTIKQVLIKFENEEYEGQESEIYDYLCEQFEGDDE